MQAMDWALERKDAIEDASWPPGIWPMAPWCSMTCPAAAFEGHTCPLGAIGHARDGVKGRLQIVYGLLCSPAGVPIAIEVFDGNTADPKTLTAQIDKLKTRFELIQHRPGRGSRHAHQRAHPRRAASGAPELDQRAARRARSRSWSTTRRCSCRCSTSRTCSRSPTRTIPASGWCAATTRPWPTSARANAHELLAATETQLQADRRRHPPRNASRYAATDKIALRVGKVRNKFKMAKHFDLAHHR